MLASRANQGKREKNIGAGNILKERSLLQFITGDNVLKINNHILIHLYNEPFRNNVKKNVRPLK